MNEELLPCPFCGAGNTEIRENGKVWSGRGYTPPTSTSVFHYCTPTAGQPSRAIERVGRDRASAIAAWNQRAISAPQAPAAPSTHAGLLAAAAHIQAKAQAHLDERGSYDPDTDAVEMSESNQEHFNTLDELAEEIRLLAEKAAPALCDKPPAGWTCSRAPGHDGPCAAAPAAPVAIKESP